MSVVESRTEEIERFSRTSTLEIRNLPLRKSLPQDELVRIAVRILKELLIDLSPSDIYDIRCIPTKQDNRTILLTLNSVILKNKILKAFRDFNKSISSNKLRGFGTWVPATNHLYVRKSDCSCAQTFLPCPWLCQVPKLQALLDSKWKDPT